MGRKKSLKGSPKDSKLIVLGGDFTRASYKFSPLSEDMKNSLISLFQFILEGQRLEGPVDVSIINDTVTIPTMYGDVYISKRDHPMSRKFHADYTFTAPMKFFTQGKRTDGRFYKEIQKALSALASTQLTFTEDVGEGMQRTTISGIINGIQIYSPKDKRYGASEGRELFVTFSMLRPVLEMFFNATRGFHKFIESECRSLSSIYAKRMYETLCSMKGGSVYRLSLGNFKEMFCIQDKYDREKDFVKYVLDPLKEDINSTTSLIIDYDIYKSAIDASNTIIEFKVLRNTSSTNIRELAKRCHLWPSAQLEYFLTNTVKMKKTEIRPHVVLFDQVAKIPNIFSELPYKWEKTCEKIPMPRFTTKSDLECIRKQRVAHFIGTLKGIVNDVKH